ncbi:MAG: helix-turn-helix domain-containing protein [Actinobacteria bacterium]|nr:helix-turn-helix domain-containing protein [Actinomycetota bacterium]
MFEIGNSLREARLRQGLEFPEIEHATKIRSKYLRALEDEQFEILPAQTYIKGFLRTYAEYLGLDGQLYVDEYNSRYVGLEEESPLRAVRQPAHQERRLAGGVVLAVVAGIAVVTALVIAAWKFGGGSSTPKASNPAHTNTGKGSHKPHKPTPKSVSIQIQATHGYGSYVVARVGSAGGRQLYAGTLEPGKIQTFRGSSIWFRLDAPANVLVSLNGSRRSLPGTGHPRIFLASPGGRLQLASAAG